MNHQASSHRDIGPELASAQHWRSRSLRKYADYGVTRGVHPRKTISTVMPLLSTMGVTRVSEITHLDRMGIPNFTTVRPRDLGPGISYYNGKGSTRLQAQASALMEAVERYSGEHCDYAVTLGTYDEILEIGAAVDPTEIIVPLLEEYRPDMRLEWVKGFDLLQRRPTYAPLNCVVCPYVADQGTALYYTSTNGLASGNFLEEALCQALCEIIERDAYALYATEIALKPAISDVLAKLGYPAQETMRADINHRYPLIAHRSLPLRAARLIGKMKRAGLNVYLRNITSTADIPTIDCTIVKPKPGGQHEIHAGYGTHPDARVALNRAITEAAQSRVAWIQGGREDLPEIAQHVKEAASPDAIAYFGNGAEETFQSIASSEVPIVNGDVSQILSGLERDGFDQVVVFDLTRPELDIPVVRVVVPRAESWPAFRLHTGRGVFGPRIVQLLQRG